MFQRAPLPITLAEKGRLLLVSRWPPWHFLSGLGFVLPLPCHPFSFWFFWKLWSTDSVILFIAVVSCLGWLIQCENVISPNGMVLSWPALGSICLQGK